MLEIELNYEIFQISADSKEHVQYISDLSLPTCPFRQDPSPPIWSIFIVSNPSSISPPSLPSSAPLCCHQFLALPLLFPPLGSTVLEPDLAKYSSLGRPVKLTDIWRLAYLLQTSIRSSFRLILLANISLCKAN